jgi:hypothetical protein
VIPDEPGYPRIAGVVVDAMGTPVQGAEVRLYRRCEDVDLQTGPNLLDHLVLTTAADGLFELRDVSRSAWAIGVSQRWKGYLDRIDLADTPDLENLRVVVASTCHVQIDATESKLELADVWFTDANGESVWVTQREGRRRSSMRSVHRFSMHGRRSPALQVPIHAVQVSFRDEQGAIHRIPLKLEPDGFLVIRP